MRPIVAEWPPFAAWEHRGARRGFEVAFLRSTSSGLDIVGHTSAIADETAWSIRYRLHIDGDGRCRGATLAADTLRGGAQRVLASDGDGRWTIDGAHEPAFDGLLEVDLESSALTNTFAIRRLALAVGDAASAPAVWVRAPDLRIERLEQRYRRLGDEGGVTRFVYEAPAFDFRVTTRHDAAGLVLDYPGVAVRAS